MTLRRPPDRAAELPFPPRRQQQFVKPLPEGLHDLIVLLRKRGHKVWRGGKNRAIVDGRHLNFRQLRSLGPQR